MADYDPTLRDTLEYGWLRGPAVVEGDSIVMPVSTAEKYDPLACQDSIGLALAAVPARFLRDELHPGIEIERTLAFVAKFGPLSYAWPRKVGSSRVIKVSLRAHIDTAWELCFVLDTATEVRKSTAGDRHALRHLWESTGKAVTAPRGRAMVEFLREKTKEAAATADSALPFCVLGLGGHPTDPGRF